MCSQQVTGGPLPRYQWGSPEMVDAGVLVKSLTHSSCLICGVLSSSHRVRLLKTKAFNGMWVDVPEDAGSYLEPCKKKEVSC